MKRKFTIWLYQSISSGQWFWVIEARGLSIKNNSYYARKSGAEKGAIRALESLYAIAPEWEVKEAH